MGLGKKIKSKKSQNKLKWKDNTPNLCDAVKTVLRGKFIVISAFSKKMAISQVYNLILHFKKLEKETKLKAKGNKNPENNRKKNQQN